MFSTQRPFPFVRYLKFIDFSTCVLCGDLQTLVDMPNTKKSDLRRFRSGMLNLCPTSTGSATAIIEIYPELKGKLNGLAVRVPLLNASLTDCVFEVEKPTTVEEVNAAMKAASESGPLKGRSDIMYTW